MNQPVPRAIKWGACERCRGGGPASELDARFCATCLPRPGVLQSREVVADRVRRALWRAAWGPKVKLDVPREPGDGPVPGQDRR
jgi:hypothetical protein